MRTRLETWFERYGAKLLLCALFCLPLKLSWTYVALIPCILLYLPVWQRENAQRFKFSSADLAVILLLAAAWSATLGINPLRSFRGLAALSFYFLTVPLVQRVALSTGAIPLLAALLAGQCIAALHSIMNSGLGGVLPDIFHGAVPESGQLALTLVCAFGLAYREAPRELSAHYRETRLALALGLCTSILLMLWGFAPELRLGLVWNGALRLLLAGVLCFAAWTGFRWTRSKKTVEERLPLVLFLGVLPLLMVALVVNLKRGPWFGVACALLLLGLRFWSKRVAICMAVGACLLGAFLTPVRSRIMQSGEHFFLLGGRNQIWELGYEFMERFPIGIGYDNSPILRSYSNLIPPELRHFHSNFLNVVVEGGWLCGFLLLGLLVAIYLDYRRCAGAIKEPRLAFSLVVALLAWQIAGIVEYNIGDSEVLLVAFVVLGILRALLIPQVWLDGRKNKAIEVQ